MKSFYQLFFKMTALITFCSIVSIASAQSPEPSCHVIISSSFEAQCLIEIDRQGFFNEEAESLIACQGNTVTYTANANTNGIGIAQYSWSVTGAIATTDIHNSTISVTWGDVSLGQISVEVTTISGQVCSSTEIVRLIERPNIYVVSTPSYVEEGDQRVIYVCRGETVEFSDMSSTTTTDIVGYFWESDPPYQSSSTLNYRIEDIQNDCQVVHRVYNNCGCYDETDFFVRVLEGERLELSCYGTVCEGAEVTYSAINPGCSQYSWFVDGGHIVAGQGQPQVTILWDDPHNGYGILGLDGTLCGNNTCPNMLSKKIPIIQNNLAIKGQDLACVGEAVLYSIPLFGSTSYSWHISPSSGVSFSSHNNANEEILYFNAPGTYHISVDYKCDFLNCGEFSSQELVVTVKDRLLITGEDRICVSNPCSLNLNENVPASWKVADVTNNHQIIYSSIANIFSWTFPHSGKYRITAEHPDYCRPAEFILSVVDAPPAPTLSDIDPDNVHISCPNSAINLKANPQNPDYTIVWNPTCEDAAPQSVSGNDVTIYYGDDVCDVHAYTYDRMLECLSSTYYTHAVSRFQLLPANLPPSITVCPGSEIHWDDANVPWQPYVVYKWQLGELQQYCASVQGDLSSNSISLLINELHYPHSYPTTFDVILRRTYCGDIVVYDTVHITIDDYRGQVSINPIPDVCQYDNILLQGSGCSANHYLWQIEGDRHTYSTNPLDYSFSQSGNFEVALSCNPYNICTNPNFYAHTSITVNVKPQPPASGLAIIDGFVSVVPSLPAGYSYSWVHDPSESGPAVPYNPSVADYVCTVTGPNGCSITLTHTLGGINCDPLPVIVSDFDPCTKSFTFAVPSPPDMVEWTISGDENMTYTINGTNNSNATVTVKNVGTYCCNAVVQNPNCQMGSNCIQVDFVPDFVFEKACNKIIIHNKSKYLNGSMQIILYVNDIPLPPFSANTPIINYTITADGTYTFRLEYLNSQNQRQVCYLGDIFMENQVRIPQITTNNPYDNNSTCDNQAIQLNATLSPTANISSVSWQFNDGSSIDKAGNTVYHTFIGGGNYIITADIKDEYGCTFRETLTINSYLSNIQLPNLTAEGDDICPNTQGRNINYIPIPPTIENTIYSWYWGGNLPISTINNSYSTFHTDNYYVDVMNKYFCQEKAMVNVAFLNAPTAIVVSPSSSYCLGDEIKCYGAPGPNTNGYSFSWSASSSNNTELFQSTDPTFAFTPSSPGTYIVNLTITDNITGCSDQTSRSFSVNPIPPAPAINFSGNQCIDNPPVVLSGSTSVTNLIHWSNGYRGPYADYYVAGPAAAWYYDPVTGCRSSDAHINIEPQPNFDALLTGCYEKCGKFFDTMPNLNVWGLSSGTESIVWEWFFDSNPINNGILTPTSYPLSLPLIDFGQYNLNTYYHNGNCNVTSPSLTIQKAEHCDCSGLEFSFSKQEWRVKDCLLIFDVVVEIHNASYNTACLDSLNMLSTNGFITLMNTDFSPTTLSPNGYYSFALSFVVNQFVPTSSVAFSIYDPCNDCYSTFTVRMMPDLDDCNIKIKTISFNTLLVDLAAVYLDFHAFISPANSLLSFWSEPPMILNYNFNGYDGVDGMGMFDMATLSQMALDNEDICFYAVTCINNQLVTQCYCIPARLFYDQFANAKSDLSKDITTDDTKITAYSSDIRLTPNPTTGKIRVIGESIMVSEIQVLDLHGRLMAVFEKTDKFDLSAIPAGVYFVRIKSKLDGSTLERVTFHKLIKK